MLQAIQYQKTGELSVKELPAPLLRSGMVVVRTQASLISAGTERTSVATAQASMLEKMRSRPDLVKQVWDMAKREGVMSTIEKVQSRLDSYKALGYSAAGVVVESGVDGFAPGDRVACAGAGYASHAEVIVVPKNLVVRIPDNVSFDEAAFTTLAAIALQGVRQSRVVLGEAVAVIGLGLLGQLTVQLLKAAGCRVIGLDINEGQFDMARGFGADEVALSDRSAADAIESFTRGLGADAVIITASTSSNDPMMLAIQAARKKGRVVVVGAVGMDVPRSPFYEKELDITIACSYGPGRYDPSYEEEGHDYPPAYVRWTEGRNMEAVLDLIAARKLDVEKMITHRIAIADAESAYDLITGKVKERYFGIILQYPDRGDASLARTVTINKSGGSRSGVLSVGFIGAGNFAQGFLIPPVKKSGARLASVSTTTAVNARSVAEKFGFEQASTDNDSIIADASIDAVFVATRHDTHGRFVAEALDAGKQVFVEKPLAINRDELMRIEQIASSKNDRVMVGFNRRFSQSLVAMKAHFRDLNEPLVMMYRVNAGFLKPEFWTQAESQGGRIIGEGCHFIDSMQFMTDARPVSVYAAAIGSQNAQVKNADSVAITIRFDDGSVGTLMYLANGDPSVAKEYFEVFGGNRTAIMENFSRVVLSRERKRKELKFDGDKGHASEVALTLEAMKNGTPMPIPFQSLIDTTVVTFGAMESLATGEAIMIKGTRELGY
ncbi:MAG: bi-domain-containing oxidoreductase [bacterium]|nr:bi-domain-containing oxidoreductase [Candidatus Kapabacteria bacterium]